jgi:hypothetical protein
MGVIDLIKEWSGTVLLIGGSIWGLVEIYYKWIAKNEDTKQEIQHTEQEKIITDEKALNLDVLSIKASKEVASEALEDLAEARGENLKLLESDYEKRKAIIEMQAEIKGIKAYINRMEEERKVLCWFFCRKAKVCPEKEPVFGPFQLDVATLESLKKMIENG